MAQPRLYVSRDITPLSDSYACIAGHYPEGHTAPVILTGQVKGTGYIAAWLPSIDYPAPHRLDMSACGHMDAARRAGFLIGRSFGKLARALGAPAPARPVHLHDDRRAYCGRLYRHGMRATMDISKATCRACLRANEQANARAGIRS